MQGDVSLVALKGNECNQLYVRLHVGYQGLVADSIQGYPVERLFGVGQGFWVYSRLGYLISGIIRGFWKFHYL